MKQLTRREFAAWMALAGAGVAAPFAMRARTAHAAAGGRVVVVGGGFGGATCANFLRQYAPQLDVTLIEPKTQYVTCPFSNTVLAGLNDIAFITHDYEQLKARRGCQLRHDRVIAIDSTARTLRLQGGASLSYDRLVVAPGISFDWKRLEGSGEEASTRVPHAWLAGEQTLVLLNQLREMPDGGVVVLSAPRKPFRAPPAMLERASLIAHYLKLNKPRSKVLLLDPNEEEPQLELVRQCWSELYPGMIERIGGSAAEAVRLDVAKRTVHTSSGDGHAGAVLNVVAAQRAGQLALEADLADASGWCPVDPTTFESTRHPRVHVIGDACIAGDMPKTAFAANNQAKACAASIIASFDGGTAPAPAYNAAIYTLISPKQAVSEACVFRVVDGRIARVAGGMSDAAAPKRIRLKEAEYAAGWYKAITAEMLAL